MLGFAHFTDISTTISNDQLQARPLELQQLGHTSAAEFFMPVLVVDLKTLTVLTVYSVYNCLSHCTGFLVVVANCKWSCYPNPLILMTNFFFFTASAWQSMTQRSSDDPENVSLHFTLHAWSL